MSIRQISVFLGNSPGRVADLTEILSSENIDISALVLSDTMDYGVLRLIVNDSEKTYKVLKENDFTVRITDVIVVPISHDPGSLNKVLGVLKEESISIEYMYAFSARETDDAFAVFKMDDLEEAKAILKRHNIKRLCENEL